MYLLIILTNSQSGATGSNFQATITVNSNTYKNYLAANISNACFQDGAENLIKSWLGSGETNTSGSTVYWVLLPNSIPGSGTQTIYLTFQSTSVNSMDGSITGAEPNYTGTYGQYDNGSSIFSYYQNFSGSSLPTGWSISSSGSASYSVNNGITMTADNSSGNIQANYSGSFSTPNVLEAYQKATQASNYESIDIAASTSSSSYVAGNYTGIGGRSSCSSQTRSGATPTCGAAMSLNTM